MLQQIFFFCELHTSVVLLCLGKVSLLDERVQRAAALLPPSHRLPPKVKEDLIATQNDAKTRYPDWAFTQGFATVVEKNDLNNGVYILDYSAQKRH